MTNICAWVHELLELIDANSSHDVDDRYVFLTENGTPNKRARQIGMLIYAEGGTHLMFDIMEILQDEVNDRISQGRDWLACDLRQLEFCWNGIGDWMA